MGTFVFKESGILGEKMPGSETQFRPCTIYTLCHGTFNRWELKGPCARKKRKILNWFCIEYDFSWIQMLTEKNPLKVNLKVR